MRRFFQKHWSKEWMVIFYSMFIMLTMLTVIGVVWLCANLGGFTPAAETALSPGEQLIDIYDLRCYVVFGITVHEPDYDATQKSLVDIPWIHHDVKITTSEITVEVSVLSFSTYYIGQGIYPQENEIIYDDRIPNIQINVSDTYVLTREGRRLNMGEYQQELMKLIKVGKVKLP